MQALYELALLRIHLWRQQQGNAELRKAALVEARTSLSSFLSLYPESYCAEQVRKNLADLPSPD
jgi:hypothetical protein